MKNFSYQRGHKSLKTTKTGHTNSQEGRRSSNSIAQYQKGVGKLISYLDKGCHKPSGSTGCSLAGMCPQVTGKRGREHAPHAVGGF
jgi:hypothetical protein